MRNKNGMSKTHELMSAGVIHAVSPTPNADDSTALKPWLANCQLAMKPRRSGACSTRKAVELPRSEEHTSELQSHLNLVCRLLLEKKKALLPQRTTTVSLRPGSPSPRLGFCYHRYYEA